MLTPAEWERYDRQVRVHGVGRRGQERLKRAKVVIAGVGGLGSTVALQLVASGVGTVRLIDCDAVEPGNLNRQVLHWSGDVGQIKVFSAAEKLSNLNPTVTIEPVARTITDGTVDSLVSGFDLVVDALDNLETRFILNRALAARGIPLFHGAVRSFSGRVMTVIPGETACLRCVYRGAVVEEHTPVIGSTAAVIGALQATEVLKYLLDIGKLLVDRFVTYDGLSMQFAEMKVQMDPLCPDCSIGGVPGNP